MKAVLLTREYPPEVYGGAGVHVEYLARELAQLIDLEVRCFGAPRAGALAFSPWNALGDAMEEVGQGEFRLRHGAARLPTTYTIQATKA